MLTHFTYHPFIAPDSRRREYQISFFHKGTQYQAVYHYNGTITWVEAPAQEDQAQLVSQIHELMLFHVYE